MSNPYPPTYPQQPPVSSYQQAPQAPQTSYQQRPAPIQTNDATNGLVHQFSHQNLGGRASPYGGARQASPSQRPRTAGAPGQQPSYSSYLNAPMPSAPQQQNLPEFQSAPERNPDKYGPLTQTNQKKCAQLAEAFFKDSVKRARDQNVRSVKMFRSRRWDELLAGLQLLSLRKLTVLPTDKVRWSNGLQIQTSHRQGVNRLGPMPGSKKENISGSCAPEIHQMHIKHLRSLARVLSVK